MYQVYRTFSYNTLFSVVFILFVKLSSGFAVAQQSTFLWDNQNISEELEGFKESHKVIFKGKNNYDRDLKILAVVPDCSACTDIVVSPNIIVKAGDFVEISGNVNINATAGNQIGRLAVYYDGIEKPDVLVYNLRYPVPFRVSPKNLIWLENRNPQTFTLYVNHTLGFSFHNYVLTSEEFSIEILDKKEGEILFQALPISDGRVRDSVSFEFMYRDPTNPENESIVRDKIFILLSLEENAKK